MVYPTIRGPQAGTGSMGKKPAGDPVTIYHNPACSTSRKVLGLIRDAGFEPDIVEYLKTPPDRATLLRLVRRMGRPLATILRRKAPAYAELDLAREGIADEDILHAIEQHPVLIERPIVVTRLGVRLCRPPETVRDILPAAAARH